MELKLLLLFLSTFYLVSCSNSATIYNDELSEDEYLPHVLRRVVRSPNTWTLETGKKSLSAEEQQEGLRHENVIYITLADNSAKSKEPQDSFNLWNVLGKTTEILATPIIKTFFPRSLPYDYGRTVPRSIFPPPRPPKYIPRVLLPNDAKHTFPTKYDPPPFFDDSLQRTFPTNYEEYLFRSKFDPPPINPYSAESRAAEHWRFTRPDGRHGDEFLPY